MNPFLARLQGHLHLHKSPQEAPATQATRSPARLGPPATPALHSAHHSGLGLEQQVQQLIETAPRYAGVGSRSTPKDVCERMRRIAARLEALGWILRSGAADGADTAFESGVSDRYAAHLAEVYLPWRGFSGRQPISHTDPTSAQLESALKMAETLHPAWSRLGTGPRKLHARNCFQILGLDLDRPVKVVICWTADGAQTEKETNSKTGGTRTAIVLADRHGIPVINLKRPEAMQALADVVKAT